MNVDRQDHLSEEAMDDVLMGFGSSDAEAHLVGCDACRETLAQFRADVGMLGKASLAWSEARSSCMPAVVIPHEEGKRRQFGMWVTAAICLLVVMAGLFLGRHGRIARRQPGAIANSSQSENGSLIQESELREDNALMVAVDEEIAPIPSPLAVYDRPGSSSGARGHRKEAAKP